MTTFFGTCDYCKKDASGTSLNADPYGHVKLCAECFVKFSSNQHNTNIFSSPKKITNMTPLPGADTEMRADVRLGSKGGSVAGDGHQASQSTKSFSVKTCLDGPRKEFFWFKVDSNHTYSEFIVGILRTCRCSGPAHVFYEDDEGDQVMLTSQNEFTEMMDLLESGAIRALSVRIVPIAIH